jgi:hypothetical protein
MSSVALRTSEHDRNVTELEISRHTLRQIRLFDRHHHAISRSGSYIVQPRQRIETFSASTTSYSSSESNDGWCEYPPRHPIGDAQRRVHARSLSARSRNQESNRTPASSNRRAILSRAIDHPDF